MKTLNQTNTQTKSLNNKLFAAYMLTIMIVFAALISIGAPTQAASFTQTVKAAPLSVTPSLTFGADGAIKSRVNTQDFSIKTHNNVTTLELSHNLTPVRIELTGSEDSANITAHLTTNGQAYKSFPALSSNITHEGSFTRFSALLESAGGEQLQVSGRFSQPQVSGLVAQN